MVRVPMATSLVWAQIARPRVPLVYLDLNHFIFMARARKGTAPAGYAELFSAALAAVEESRVVIPLSSEHVWEMSAIKDPRQRRDVADVMEALTRYQYLIGRPDIAQLEVEAGFRAIFEEQHDVLPFPLVDTGFGRAFGVVGGLRIEDEHGRDVTAATRQEIGPAKFNRAFRQAHYTLERGALEGPSDAEVAELRAEGYAPEVAQESQRSRLAYELALTERLDRDPTWRRGRLRDVISAREISHEWLDTINRVIRNRARDRLPVPDKDDDKPMNQLFAAMPQSQVAISMKTRYHRNPSHRWTTNDIVDIDALSVAFAYCDVVFTDSAARSALKDSPELKVIDTLLPKKPTELTEWLQVRPKVLGADLLIGSARLT